jgi:hypothetical protein
LIGIGVRCAAFNLPNAKAISSPITNPMTTRGIRLIDFAELRRPRTAIYVVVPEGDAVRYKVVLATLFGLAASHLRRGEIKLDAVPVLFNFDEAGNIFVHGLSELLGVGRGRRLCVALGYSLSGEPPMPEATAARAKTDGSASAKKFSGSWLSFFTSTWLSGSAACGHPAVRATGL